MAAITFPGGAIVNVIFVAGAAILGRVDAPEREDAVVVKIRLVPIAVRGFMAKLAGRRKTGGHVVRIPGLLVIGAMTAITFPRSPGVNSIFMAGGALERGMDTLTGKDAVMVEGSLIPAGVGRQMAQLAGRRETRLGMVRLGGLFIILSVAGIAIKGSLTKVSALMAIVTAQVPVGGVERHPRPGTVIPVHGGPGDGTVAILAVTAQRSPIGVVLAADPVAVKAAPGRSFIDSVKMAGGAGDLEVAPFKRKSPRLMKTAGDRAPAGGSMTGVASLGHRALMGFGVAGTAVSLIGHVGADFMTGGTILGQEGVLSPEGKPRLCGMVKVFRVEGPDIEVNTLMLLVTGFAVALDLAVHPLFGGDSLGNRLMTSQTAGCVNLLSLSMTLPAVRFALQGAVRLGKKTGRGKLCLRILAGQG